MKKMLLLRLEGPLQSWGEYAKWDARKSASFPTKSGIVGLIACAMGLPRNSEQIVRLCEEISIAIRADRPGISLLDYHSVEGHPLKTAEGKKRSTGNIVITQREYLQDASFLVVVETSEEWYTKIIYAFQHPKWCIYLGRKSCVPTRPILEAMETEYKDMLDALTRHPAAMRAQYPLRYEWEQEQECKNYHTRPDQLMGKRRFRFRKVWSGIIEEDCNVSNKN